jgi:hypothetical protein
MCRSLAPSRAGFALALAALLIPIAVSWASTIVSYTAFGQTMAANQPASNATMARRDGIRVYRPAGNTALLARVWCRNSAVFSVANVTCQTTKP